MIRALIITLLFPVFLCAGKQDCTPHPGSDFVCDSIAKRCRETAYAMTQRACAVKTSPYYDSLYCWDGYLSEFDFALRSFYNDLADTLADFRTYLGFYPGIDKDSDTLISLYVSPPRYGTVKDSSTMTGNRQIDSLCTLWKFRFVSYVPNGPYLATVTFTCPKMINRSYVYRRVHSIDHMSKVSGYAPPSPYDRIAIDGDSNNGDLLTITVCEYSGKCMPPELPCAYIRRTFIAQREWSCRYTRFERGVLPWPNIPEVLKEE